MGSSKQKFCIIIDTNNPPLATYLDLRNILTKTTNILASAQSCLSTQLEIDYS